LDPQDLEKHLQDQVAHQGRFFDFFWHVVRSRFVLQALRRHQKTRSVVDIGAGAGVFFRHYLDAFPGARYCFIEPIPVLQRHLAAQPGCEAVLDLHAPLAQEAVVLLDVLEHLEDDRAFIADLQARMSSGSLLVLTCPAFQLLWSDWDKKLGHRRRYTLRGFRSVVSAAGFEVLESRYLFHLFMLPALWRRLFPGEGSEFPVLPPAANRALTRWGLLELKWLKWLPFGTSVAIVARKR
jgi:hypothetical protein